MDVTHIGHSCLLVETSDTRVLIDPGVFSPGFVDVDGLDAVLVTHRHPDHLDVERLPQLLAANPRARLLVEPQTAAELAGAGIDAEPLPAGQSAVFGRLTVDAAGGRHAVIHTDIPRIGNCGYLLTEDDGPRLFHPGDMIDTVPDGVDVLALPLNAPWAAAKETANFLRAVSPDAWFPIHDGLLAPQGRGIYLTVIGGLAPEGSRRLDVDDSGRVAGL